MTTMDPQYDTYQLKYLNLTLLLQNVDLFLIEESFITIAPLEEWGRHIFTKGTTHGQGQCPPRLN